MHTSASTSSIPDRDARPFPADVTSEMAKIFSDDPRSLPPSRKLWSSVGKWPNPDRYSDRSQGANWLRTTTNSDGGLEWHYPRARYSMPVPLAQPFPSTPPTNKDRQEAINRRVISVLGERLRIVEQEVVETRAQLADVDAARKHAERAATSSAELAAAKTATVAALREELVREKVERDRLTVQQEQLQHAQAAAAQLLDKPVPGLTAEGVWFRKWRSLCWRRLNERHRQSATQAHQLHSQLHAAKQALDDQQAEAEDQQAEVERQRKRSGKLLRDLAQSEAARHEQEEVLRLQRGFSELRLRQVARRMSGESSQHEYEAQEMLERKLREQTASYEALLQRQQESSEAELARRESVLREQISDQIAGEQRKEMEKRMNYTIKKKVEAARQEATEQVTKQLTEEFQQQSGELQREIERQQAEIEVLRTERDNALRKAEIYKARIPK
jgi:hypothetical protein